MRVLTVYAHPNPNSFCRAILQQFVKGLEEAGHSCEMIDLHAIKFNPVFGLKDFAYFADDSVPTEILEEMKLKERVLALSGGPMRRLLIKQWLRKKDLSDVVKLVGKNKPRDVLEQQEKVARAEGLAFIAPIFWMNFPAILKGWIDRVFSYGFAYSLSPDGWNGDLDGRVSLLTHKKALIMTTTFFKESDYQLKFGDAINTLIDDWYFRYPGIETVEHEYFYATRAVDDNTRQVYLKRAYQLGKSTSDVN